jgi:hypothetical protein
MLHIKQEVTNASLLYEMSNQEGNERSQKHNHEERQASDSGPGMWHEDVPNWQGLSQQLI